MILKQRIIKEREDKLAKERELEKLNTWRTGKTIKIIERKPVVENKWNRTQPEKYMSSTGKDIKIIQEKDDYLEWRRGNTTKVNNPNKSSKSSKSSRWR